MEKRVTQVIGEQNDRKSGAIKASCVRGGAILRDGFPAGERAGKKTFRNKQPVEM